MEILHICGDQSVDPLAGQDDIGDLFIRTHVGQRAFGRLDIFAAKGRQRKIGLQGELVIEIPFALCVFTDTEADLQFSFRAGHVLGIRLDTVQIVGKGDIPGQLRIFHCSLDIDLPSGLRTDRDPVPVHADRIRRGQILDCGIVAVIHDLSPVEDIDHIDAFNIPGGVGDNIYDLLLAAGVRQRAAGRRKQKDGGQEKDRTPFNYLFHQQQLLSCCRQSAGPVSYDGSRRQIHTAGRAEQIIR